MVCVIRQQVSANASQISLVRHAKTKNVTITAPETVSAKTDTAYAIQDSVVWIAARKHALIIAQEEGFATWENVIVGQDLKVRTAQ